MFSPAKKPTKRREIDEYDPSADDGDLPLSIPLPDVATKKRRVKKTLDGEEELPGPDDQFPGQIHRSLTRESSDVPNQLALAAALRSDEEPDFWTRVVRPSCA